MCKKKINRNSKKKNTESHEQVNELAYFPYQCFLIWIIKYLQTNQKPNSTKEINALLTIVTVSFSFFVFEGPLVSNAIVFRQI